MEELFEIIHQMVDLILRTIPVLGREGIERHDMDLELAANFEQFDDAVAGLFVPKITRQSPQLGPAAVAVHDKSNVIKLLG